MQTTEKNYLIILDLYEKRFIKFCKGHYKDKYKSESGRWIDSLKPLHDEIYGWSSEEHYNDFLDCMFNKLLDIYLKIQYDQTGCNGQIKEVFDSAFRPSLWNDDENPIERAIVRLCGLIQCNRVMIGDLQRYSLEIEGEKDQWSS